MGRSSATETRRHPAQNNDSVVSLKTSLLVLAVNSIYIAQCVNIVGSGTLARSITAIVGDSTDTNWPASILAILTVVLSPPVSQAADYWGRRWFLVCLTACGCIGSITISHADSVGMAIAGFTVSGISFGAQPLLHAVTSEVLPRKLRPLAQGIVNTTSFIGVIISLMMGGSLTRHDGPAGFRTFWYISAAIYAAAAVVCAIFYRPPLRELQVSLTTWEKLRRLDWVGYVLLTAGLTLFCVSLAWSQNPYLWTNAHIIATFVPGIVLLSALLVYEWRFKRDGMFHHDLFANRNFPIALACVFVEGLVFFAANNYFAFEVSTFYPMDPLLVDAHYSIVFVVAIVAALVAGSLCSVKKVIRVPTVCAFVSFIIFNVIMANINAYTSGRNIWAYAIFMGFGLGTCMSSLIAVAQFSTPPQLIAITSGLMLGVRSLGGAIGLAIYTAVFNHGLADNLGSKIAAATLPLGLPQSSLGSLITSLTSSDPSSASEVHGASSGIIAAAEVAVREAFAIAFRYVWIAAGSFTLVALVASFFLFDPKQEFNHLVDAPMDVVRSRACNAPPAEEEKNITSLVREL